MPKKQNRFLVLTDLNLNSKYQVQQRFDIEVIVFIRISGFDLTSWPEMTLDDANNNMFHLHTMVDPHHKYWVHPSIVLEVTVFTRFWNCYLMTSNDLSPVQITIGFFYSLRFIHIPCVKLNHHVSWVIVFTSQDIIHTYKTQTPIWLYRFMTWFK